MSDTAEITFGSNGDKRIVETESAFAPKFDHHGLIVAMTQDSKPNEVFVVAYMNRDSLKNTLPIGEADYFSQSRQEILHKESTSSQTQAFEKILADSDKAALVLKLRQKGPACCHTGYRSCFYRNIQEAGDQVSSLQ